jgi:CRP-like cAMP-binding protein
VEAKDEADLDLDLQPGAILSSVAVHGTSAADVEALPLIPLFSGLSRTAFVELVHELRMWTAQPGELVLAQGEESDSFFVIVKGHVRVTRRVEGQEQEVELSRLGADEFFGEISVFSGAARTATVTAIEETELLEIPRASLFALVDKDPSIEGVLLRFCRHRMLVTMMVTSKIFRDLPVELKQDAILAFRTREAEAGQVIVEEGGPGRGLFMILSGEVALQERGPDDVVRHERLAEGSFFGESSLLGHVSRIRAMAARKTTLLHLTRRGFALFCGKHAEMHERLLALHRERTTMSSPSSGRIM